MKIASALFVASGLLWLSGCGGTSATRDTTLSFPHTFELLTLASDDVSSAHGALGASPANFTDRVEALIAGTIPLNDVFTPNLLYKKPIDATCYGPKMKYDNNPDDATPNHGELPSGDLGIWQVNEGNTTEACTAAELNARMDGVKERTKSGLFLLASTLDALYDSGGTLPAVGSLVDVTASMPTIPDVSFAGVTIQQPAANTFQYDIAFTYTRSGTPYNIQFQIIHKGASTGTTYKGLMTYQIEDTTHGGNCGAGENNITRKGTLVYERSGSDAYDVDAREAEFCSHSFSGGFTSSDLLDPSDKFDAGANPDGWGNNFSRFVADYKISNRAGQYVYAWQAGPGDGHTRVLQIGLNDHATVDGESYFGYGADIASTTATFGENHGMICNWAGPGASHTLQLYAQRQFLEYNSTTGLFETKSGWSDITYAPTNSCQYDGSGTFAYDRNLDGSLTGSDIAVVTAGAGGDELEFDLYSNGSYTTVADMIIARGTHLPTAPTWP